MSSGDGNSGGGGVGTGSAGGSAKTDAPSKPKTPPAPPRMRMLQYALKGDWSGVEGVLRSASRADSEVMASDPVSQNEQTFTSDWFWFV